MVQLESGLADIGLERLSIFVSPLVTWQRFHVHLH